MASFKPSSQLIRNEVYVMKGLNLERPSMSRYASQSLKLINKVDAISNEEYKNNTVNQYPDLFANLGEIEGEYKINLVENSTPFALTTPRKVLLPLLSKTKQEIGRMLEMGAIKRVDEPTDWCAPTVVVPKPSGEVRICFDLTKLNANINPSFTMPFGTHTFYQGRRGSSRPPSYLKNRCPYEHEIFEGIREAIDKID